MMSFIIMLLLQWGAINSNTTTLTTIQKPDTYQQKQPTYTKGKQRKTLNIVEEEGDGM